MSAVLNSGNAAHRRSIPQVLLDAAHLRYVLLTLTMTFAFICESSLLRAAENPAADSQKGATQAPSATHQDKEEIVVSGSVLKPDGTPAAGAMIRSAAPVTPFLELRLGHPFVSKMVETTADDQGRFKISVSKTPYRALGELERRWLDLWKETVIAASLKGFGPAWIEYVDIEADKTLTLQLVEDLPIRGQIVDLEGNPVRGTAVRIVQLQQMKEGSLDRVLLDAPESRRPLILNQPLPVQRNFGLREIDPRLLGLTMTWTNDDGWMQIPHVGKERLVRIAFEGGEIAYRTATFVSRDTKPIPQARVSQLPGAPEPDPVYGAEFKLASSPTRPVEGVVVDAKTGQPMPGFSVEIDGRGGSRPVRHVIRTTTDQAGRFRLMGLPKAARNRIVAIPPSDQPYFPRSLDVPDPVGIDAIELKIEAHRGIWITGQVTNKATHQPVMGMHVHYHPYLTNEVAQQIPTFRNGRLEGDKNLYVTGIDGSYRLVGLPGQGVVSLENEFMRYLTGVGFGEIAAGRNARSDGLAVFQDMTGPTPVRTFVVRDVNASADEQEVHLDLEVDPGASTRIRIVDQQGLPVPGTGVFGAGTGAAANDSTETADAILTLENLSPNQSHTLQALHRQRQLGLKFQIEPPYDPDRVMTIVVQPLAIVKGRLLDGGEPISRASIMPSYSRTDASGQMLPGMATNGSFATKASGEFECHLIPGNEYDVRVRSPNLPLNAVMLAEKLKVTAGETVDLGELHLGPDGFRPVKKEDSK